jgi:hypothetical protein
VWQTALVTRRECEMLCRVEHALVAEGDGTVCGVRRWRQDMRSSRGIAGKGVWVLRDGRDADINGGSREARSRSSVIHPAGQHKNYIILVGIS